MDIKGRIHEIFTKGAAQAGELRSGKGSVDDAADVRYIDNEVKIFKAEVRGEDDGITDLQALAQSEAEIEVIVKSEMQEMLGASFAKGLGIEKTEMDNNGQAKFSDEEISLENLMSLLDDDVDKEKVAEHNKKGSTFGKIVASGIDSEFASYVADGLKEDVNVEKLSAHNTNPINDRQNGVKKNPEEFGDEVPMASMMFALSDLIWS
jgi:hypothetical protein